MTGLRFPLLLLCGLLALNAAARGRELMPIPYGLDFVRFDSAVRAESPPLLGAPEGEAYLVRVGEAEERGGPYGAALSESLIEAANYFESRNDPERAVGLLRRAVHVTRVNEGLYSPRQTPLLERMLAAHIAAGDLDSADEVQEWLFRVRRRNSSPGEKAYIDAAIQYAEWQRRRWLLNPEPEEPRLLFRIWRLLEEQLPEEGEAPLSTDELGAVVYAQVDLLYLIGGSDFGPDREAERLLGRGYVRERERSGSFARDQMQYLRQTAFARGKKRLARLGERLEGEGDSSSRAELERRLGDWNLWYSNYTAAADRYRRSWELLDSDTMRADWFGEPTELPAGEILYPDAAGAAGEPKVVSARFGVSARGRPFDIEADDFRLVRWLRGTRFRPRIEGGEMVASSGIAREYRLNKSN